MDMVECETEVSELCRNASNNSALILVLLCFQIENGGATEVECMYRKRIESQVEASSSSVARAKLERNEMKIRERSDEQKVDQLAIHIEQL